jgi:hypothetical protein
MDVRTKDTHSQYPTSRLFLGQESGPSLHAGLGVLLFHLLSYDSITDHDLEPPGQWARSVGWKPLIYLLLRQPTAPYSSKNTTRQSLLSTFTTAVDTSHCH